MFGLAVVKFSVIRYFYSENEDICGTNGYLFVERAQVCMRFVHFKNKKYENLCVNVSTR